MITLRMGNHAQHSGYDRLLDHLDCRVITSPKKWSPIQRAVAKSLQGLTIRSGIKWYNRSSMYSEFCAFLQWFRRSGQIFHFIYGENSYRYLGCLKRSPMKNKIVATYHTPPEKFHDLIPDDTFLKGLDAIIVVSNVQQNFFADRIGAHRVFYVPHGINIHYYQPQEAVPGSRRSDRKFNCLFVGRHMRDFGSLSETIKAMSHIDPEVHFRGVISDEFHGQFRGLPNVMLMSGIPDEELLALYRQSDLLVLPLIGCTANNSILEAMACGLPVISTDLTGTRDYMDDACGILVPRGDVRGILQAIQALKADSERRAACAAAARKRAMAFSWENVARRLRQVYRMVMDEQCAN